jgi:hypothetical protein
MTCSTCANWNPKASHAMAKQHFALCKKGPIWEYHPPSGKCNDYKPAAADVVAKRVVWLEKANA